MVCITATFFCLSFCLSFFLTISIYLFLPYVALIALLSCPFDLIQRQAAKALANLGVNHDNKRIIAEAGGLFNLVTLAKTCTVPVKIECIAALANLAVNDSNEVEIVRIGGLTPIVNSLVAAEAVMSGNCDIPLRPAGFANSVGNMEELAAQCCRALRNLSVNAKNRSTMIDLGVLPLLLTCCTFRNNRISQQAQRAIKNLNSKGIYPSLLLYLSIYLSLSLYISYTHMYYRTHRTQLHANKHTLIYIHTKSYTHICIYFLYLSY